MRLDEFPPTRHDDPDAYVALGLDEARQRAEDHGWSRIRVLPDDDTVLLTSEADPRRINFAVGDNRVTYFWCY